MSNKTRKQLQQLGYRLEPMTSKTIRMPHKTWEKLGWMAEEKGLQIPDLIRSTLAHATRDARPPQDVNARVLNVTDETWEMYQRIAAKSQKPLEQIIDQILQRLGRQLEI